MIVNKQFSVHLESGETPSDAVAHSFPNMAIGNGHRTVLEQFLTPDSIEGSSRKRKAQGSGASAPPGQTADAMWRHQEDAGLQSTFYSEAAASKAFAKKLPEKVEIDGVTLAELAKDA